MTDSSPPPAPEMAFEDHLKALETLVGQLERNELPLAKALEAYAQGMQLIKACEGQLAQAELKLTEITAQGQREIPLTEADS